MTSKFDAVLFDCDGVIRKPDSSAQRSLVFESSRTPPLWASETPYAF
jgi:hypothetical protein